MNFESKKKVYMYLNILCVVMILVTIIIMIVSWNNIAEEVPTHIGVDGVVDETGDKKSVIMLPILNIIMFIMISVIEKFPSLWNIPIKVTEENKLKVYSITKSMIVAVKFVFTAMFSGLAISIINGAKYTALISAVSATIMFAIIIYSIIRILKCK